jgi:hypothetical protein
VIDDQTTETAFVIVRVVHGARDAGAMFEMDQS